MLRNKDFIRDFNETRQLLSFDLEKREAFFKNNKFVEALNYNRWGLNNDIISYFYNDTTFTKYSSGDYVIPDYNLTQNINVALSDMESILLNLIAGNSFSLNKVEGSKLFDFMEMIVALKDERDLSQKLETDTNFKNMLEEFKRNDFKFVFCYSADNIDKEEYGDDYVVEKYLSLYEDGDLLSIKDNILKIRKALIDMALYDYFNVVGVLSITNEKQFEDIEKYYEFKINEKFKQDFKLLREDIEKENLNSKKNKFSFDEDIPF